MNQNLIYQIGLTLVKGIGNITAKQVIDTLGNAEVFFKEKARLLTTIPGITPRIIAEAHKPEILERAEKEALFIEKNKIRALFITDQNYPQRFKECIDAPILLYFKGNSDINSTRVISLVGTRHATSYGKEMTEQFIRHFAEKYPDIIIVSGLAYGIDIVAHKAALKENVSTIAVLAHGLDRIYPFQHRNTAIEMLGKGGLLTDFISETNPDRQNFVKRNRIVAGISDCTIVIESAEKGGALITANIAYSYNKDVFALPGKVTETYSQGCNNLIKDKKAVLVQNANDVIYEMCWEKRSDKPQSQAVQKNLFIELSEDGHTIVDLLSKTESLHINNMAIELNLPVSRLSVILFDLEMNGIVKAIPGGMYRVI